MLIRRLKLVRCSLVSSMAPYRAHAQAMIAPSAHDPRGVPRLCRAIDQAKGPGSAPGASDPCDRDQYLATTGALPLPKPKRQLIPNFTTLISWVMWALKNPPRAGGTEKATL